MCIYVHVEFPLTRGKQASTPHRAQGENSDDERVAAEFAARSREVAANEGQAEELEGKLRERYATISELEGRLRALEVAATSKLKMAQLSALSVAEMKDELRARGLPTTGQKEEITARLVRAL